MLYKTRLKLLRDNEEVKAKDLARILNISKNLYSMYENEKQIMPVKYLNVISNYFGVSFDYLFEFTDKPNYSDSNKDINVTTVGERLKSFRKANCITQQYLAGFLNTYNSVISRYENGEHLIATPFLYDICKKYGVSADWLLGKVEDNETIYYVKKN